jgi:transposase InsO family protein
MKLHGNARTCPKSRRLLVERILREKWSVADAAEAAGVSERTARKWLARFKAEGQIGLFDRSSAPKRIPHRTPADRVAVIRALRRLRMTAAEIAEALEMALSTVSLWLKRIGLGKRSRLDPPEPANRYERRQPGELVHIDVKKLGRFKVAGKRLIGGRHGSRGYGWDYVHVMIDDRSRLAYAEVLPDQRADTAVRFLTRGRAWFATLGIQLQRVMTDNGSCYLSAAYAIACRQLRLRHLRTRAYRPRTNGKAERFIQTLQNEWAYGRLYASSTERTAALPTFLNHYNFTRRHGSLGHQPPATRLNNLLRNYS